jgi:hypothetical protein
MNPRSAPAIVLFLLSLLVRIRAAPALADSPPGDIIVTETVGSGDFPLVHEKTAAPIFLDNADYPGALRAAADLQADIERVTEVKPELTSAGAPAGKTAVLAGTLGHNPLIDGLVKSGKIKTDAIAGKWESFLITTVANPLPNVEQALIIVGSDRRGTIYGLYEISRQIGVSPWYWWADVPPQHHDALFIKSGEHIQGPPAVKYRGIFINDEDWGMNVWASKTFDPEFKNIGPKTYANVFELLLRLRLNYIWPAMHACSTEFGSVPENVALADTYGIVAGSSHCEPMLCNNVHWNEKTRGRWNYSTNRDVIHTYWEDNAKARGSAEAVWTLGIRGIHDAAMETPPNDMPGKLQLMSEVLHNQRALLDQYVSKQWGPVAQCFVPYKEVLPIYDAGLKVPDDVTLVWVDDNFGYIRRLSAPEERSRSGGAGVYWHLSYYGGPHSYTWINTTPPALIWEELHKAWANDARNLWVINVGDIKPAEIGIDYFSRLAWNPDELGADSQPLFLRRFADGTFGDAHGEEIAGLLRDFYRLGTIHKPELMNRAWAMSLPASRAAELTRDYAAVLKNEESLAAEIPARAHDAYTEMIGFPARVLGDTGLIFMADRNSQLGQDVAANANEIARLRADLEARVKDFNTRLAGGKWNHMMPGLVTGGDLTKWSSQVRWPWGEKATTQTAASEPHQTSEPAAETAVAERTWRDAASADRRTAHGETHWTDVAGLGPSGHAVALEPPGLASASEPGDTSAPTLEFDFIATVARGGDHDDALIDFLPTFRIYPGLQLRVAVTVDAQAATVVEIPGSSGKEDERGQTRANAVQDNYVRARIPLPALSPGKHVLKIRAIDAGAVVDRVSLPS